LGADLGSHRRAEDTGCGWGWTGGGRGEVSVGEGSLMSVTQRGGAVSNLYQVLDASPVVTRSWVASEDKSWFAIQTRPRHEKSVTAGLQEKGIKVFLPLLSENHRWSDRCRVVDVPLFPSYVFIQTADTPATRILVLRTLGVVQFVGVRGA